MARGFWTLLALLMQLSGSVAEETNNGAEIKSLHIVSDIRFRFAKTRILSRVVNYNTTGSEITFDVTIPDGAFITDFRFEIDKNVYVGVIAERETSENRYQVSKASGQPTGHVRKSSFHDSNTFRMTVYVPATTKVTFNLTYEEVLERRQGAYTHEIFLDPGHLVPDLKIEVAVQDTRDITTLKVPPLQTDMLTTTDFTEESTLAVIRRPSSSSAYIQFQPSLEDQKARFEGGMSGIFSVLYDVDRGQSSGDVLVSNGYFVHFFAPDVDKSFPKDIVFILDTSTSMFREKMDQVKEAMSVILKELNPEDRFNIITFSSRTKLWQTGMADVKNTTNIKKAIKFIGRMKSVGWTNIGKSTKIGMEYLTKNSRHPEGSMIIFLTDGRATSGEVNKNVILKNIMNANKKKIPVYTLAFGRDADWELMKKMSLQNHGIGRRIYVDGKPAHQIEGFYKEISSTMLHGLKFKYSDDLSPKPVELTVPLYHGGSEVVLAAPLYNNSVKSVIVDISGNSPTGMTIMQTSASELDLQNDVMKLTDLYEDKYALDKMIQRMWANLQIKELLKKRANQTDKNEREKLKQKALKLSLKYNLITPFTSLLAVVQSGGKKLTDLERNNNLYTYDEKPKPTPPPYVPRRRYYGGGGGGGSRGGGGGDPHFMVYMDGLKYPICFDVNGEDNEIYQFLHDPHTDLTVNIRMGKGKKHNHEGGFRVYIVEVSVMLNDLTFLITRNNISLPGQSFSWKTGSNTSVPGAQVFIRKLTKHIDKLSIVFDSRLVVDITNHAHRESDPLGGDFLNIELGNQHLLSEETDGVLGQFMHKKMRLGSIGYRGGHLIGHLRSSTGLVKTHGRARVKQRRDPVWGDKTSCWMLHRNARKLFDAPPEYYVITDIFQKTLS